MQQNIHWHLTAISSNAKTGPIPVSTSGKQTCPSNCSLKGQGCYAELSHLGIHWQAVTNGKRGKDYATFCNAISRLPKGQLWRCNQAGDLMPLADNLLDQKALAQLVKANKGKRGFTYTHYPVLGNSFQSLANRKAIREANNGGFIVNLSAESYNEADAMLAMAIAPVVTIQPEDSARVEYTPQGNKIVTCPATYKEYVTCATCKLCALPLESRKGVIIGFPVHGIGKKKAGKVFMLKQERA